MEHGAELLSGGDREHIEIVAMGIRTAERRLALHVAEFDPWLPQSTLG